MSDDFVADLLVGNKRSEWDSEKQNFALGSVLLSVFNQVGAVNVNLAECILKLRVVDFQVHQLFGSFIFHFSYRAVVFLYDLASGVEHL